MMMLKRGRISLAQAEQAVAVYEHIPIRFVDVELPKTLKIAAEMNIYAYNAYLIACARTQRCPLLTLDGVLIRAARQAGVSVAEVIP